jgi:hypothetical protein
LRPMSSLRSQLATGVRAVASALMEGTLTTSFGPAGIATGSKDQREALTAAGSSTYAGSGLCHFTKLELIIRWWRLSVTGDSVMPPPWTRQRMLFNRTVLFARAEYANDFNRRFCNRDAKSVDSGFLTSRMKHLSPRRLLRTAMLG